MNIFKQLNKLPQTDINEVSYGYKKHVTDRANSVCHRWTAEDNPSSKTAKLFEGKRYSEWAKELGVTIQCIHFRIKNYGDPYAQVNRTNHGHFEGKSNGEWADILEVSIYTIHGRRNRFGNPFYHGDRNYIGNGYKNPPVPPYEGRSAEQWAEELGITKGVVGKRLRSWGHPYNKTTCKQMGLKLINNRLDNTDK